MVSIIKKPKLYIISPVFADLDDNVDLVLTLIKPKQHRQWASQH